MDCVHGSQVVQWRFFVKGIYLVSFASLGGTNCRFSCDGMATKIRRLLSAIPPLKNKVRGVLTDYQ